MTDYGNLDVMTPSEKVGQMAGEIADILAGYVDPVYLKFLAFQVVHWHIAHREPIVHYPAASDRGNPATIFRRSQ
jgi:hypothetical protein